MILSYIGNFATRSKKIVKQDTSLPDEGRVVVSMLFLKLPYCILINLECINLRSGQYQGPSNKCHANRLWNARASPNRVFRYSLRFLKL